MTRISTLAAIALPCMLCGQTDPQALVQTARAKIVENLEKLPKYTCVQTVQRVRFEPLAEVKGNRCRDVAEAASLRLTRAWSDQFKLDVTVADGAEIYSWAGAREFQSADAQQIVGGGLTGSGDFGPFLLAIFGGNAEYQYVRTAQNIAVYQYHVPASASHYQIKTGSRPGEMTTVAYEGTFWIDTQTAELRHMTIVVPRPPLGSETCRAETTIDYQPFQIGESRLPLPQSTLLDVWDTDGMRYNNRIAYASCRAFQSESVFRVEGEAETGGAAAAVATAKAPVEIPGGIAVRIALTTAIDGDHAFAGDAADGRLTQAIRGRGGRVVAPEGAVVHGRIVRLEQQFIPTHYYALGLKFLSMTVGGAEVPLELEFVARSSPDKILNGAAERRQGIGVVMVRDERLKIGAGFVSEWKTVEALPKKLK